MRIKLFLARHGECLDNSLSLINGRRDTALTALGRTQAMALAENLQRKGITCIYTSPLQRAVETASIIANRLGIAAISVEKELIERDYGILTGRPTGDIPKLAREVILFNGFRYVIDSEGIEHYVQLFIRAGSVLQKIFERHPSETILIVAHNEIIKMIRANVNKTSWQDELLVAPLTNCEVIALECAAPADEPDHVGGERSGQ